MHTLRLKNINNPIDPTDALNLQTADLRYMTGIDGVTLNKNELSFINDIDVILQSDLSSGKTLNIKDSSDSSIKISIG